MPSSLAEQLTQAAFALQESRTPADAPIAAGGPAPAPRWRPQDPLRALDELMEVLEALAPALPQRPLRPIGRDYRL